MYWVRLSREPLPVTLIVFEGIGTAGLAPIGYDESYRVKVDELEKAVLQYKGMGYCIIAIIGIAGATETGSVDPLDSLARISNKYGVHFHVDAAWVSSNFSVRSDIFI